MWIHITILKSWHKQFHPIKSLDLSSGSHTVCICGSQLSMAGRTPVLDPPKVAKSILAQFQRLQSVCGCLYCVRPVSRQRHGRRAEQETAAHVRMAKGREKGKEQRGKGEGQMQSPVSHPIAQCFHLGVTSCLYYLPVMPFNYDLICGLTHWWSVNTRGKNVF